MRATRIVLAFALAALAAAALLGCIERPPKATMTADDPAGRAQCFANQQSVEDAVHVALINDPGKNMPANYGQVKSLGFVKELSWCPAGGNMIWVPTEGGFMDCDVHGRWQDQPAQ